MPITVFHLAVSECREGVHERIGRGIVGLPRIAERAGYRGKQHEEIERQAGRGGVEVG